MFRIILAQILLIILIIGAVNVVSVKKETSLDVIQRQLVTQNIEFPSDIYENHDAYCTKCAKKKNFKGDVLGFVTPSNTKGYETSQIFAKKFNILSPVWLELTDIDEENFEVTGLDNVNKRWMKKVKENSRVKIVPKLTFAKLSDNQVVELLNNNKLQDSLIKFLIDFCDEHNFDGLVFELFAKLGWSSKSKTNRFIVKLGEKFHDYDMKIYLVIHPPFWSMDMDSDDPKGAFTKNDFDQLKDSVDGFPLALYDYSEYMTIAPNAPLKWIKKNVLHFLKDEEKEYKKKVLMGLNFFGVRFDRNNRRSNEPINGTRFIELLKSEHEMEINYNEEDGEHSFDTEEHRIYYPTLYSIKKRLELADQFGTGVFIWELGQGLDYFYDLF